MEQFNWIFNWVAGLGGATALSWVLLAFFAPSLLSVVSSWLVALSPLVKALAEFFVSFFKHLWEGFKDMVDNVSSIIFVCTCIAAASWYFHVPQIDKVKVQQEYLQHLKTNYILTPKTKGRR